MAAFMIHGRMPRRRFTMKLRTHALLLLAFSCQAVSAQQGTVAESLFREGREAMNAGALDTACSKFAESHRLDPALGTLLNLALCEEKRGRLATAWEKFHEFVDTAPPRDDRRSVAWSHIKTLEPKLPKLEISLTGVQPADAIVHLDGVELHGASFGSPIAIDPGFHIITLTIAREIVRREEFEIHPGHLMDLELAAPSEQSNTDTPPADEVSKPAPDTLQTKGPVLTTHASRPGTPSNSAHRWRTHAIIAGAVGAAALVTSAVMGSLALGKKQDVQRQCPDGVCDAAGLQAANAGRSLVVAADVTLAIGLASVLSCGAFLWQSSLTPPAPPHVGSFPAVIGQAVLLSYGGTLP
jgi:hypothetical protein